MNKQSAVAWQLIECWTGEIKGNLLAPDSSESLCCVLEQDTLSAAYWFNRGRQKIFQTWLKQFELGGKASTPINCELHGVGIGISQTHGWDNATVLPAKSDSDVMFC